MSTAEIAVAATPGRPMFRTARAIASAAPGTSSALRPATAPASTSAMTLWAAAAAYVQPMPRAAPARAEASTIVVLSQASVPSASGASVGIT